MRLTKQAEIDNDLMALIYQHNSASPGIACWGWGASLSQSESKDTPCVDCGKPASLLFVDVFRCWRCAFWRHVPKCDYIEV